MDKKEMYNLWQERNAWKILRFYMANKALLKDEKHSRVCDKAKDILVENYCLSNNDSDKTGVEKAFLIAACWLAKTRKKKITIDEETVQSIFIDFETLIQP